MLAEEMSQPLEAPATLSIHAVRVGEIEPSTGESPSEWVLLTRELEWAKLLRRTFGLDVLRCAHCGGRLPPFAAIIDRATARKSLEHLGLPLDVVTARPHAHEPAEVWADTLAAPP